MVAGLLQITPIGSCRIVTPLNLTAETFGFCVNRSRTYGFVHSSAEAVQMVRVMLGEIEPPVALWPYIGRGADREGTLATPHIASDLYVVEICSAKQVSIDGFYVQINYLYSAFRGFFSDTRRARGFWENAARQDQNEIDAFLRENWSQTPERSAETSVLRRIRSTAACVTDIERDVGYLMQALPETLFVTHVDAARPNGALITSRSNHIRLVEGTVRRLGGRVYNPTKAMREFGQENAIADHSKGLAHFSEPFAIHVVGEWIGAGMGDSLARSAARSRSDEKPLLDHVNRLLSTWKVEGLDTRLEWVLRKRPEWSGILEARFNLALAEGNQELASKMVRTMPVDDATRPTFERMAEEAAAGNKWAALAAIRSVAPDICRSLGLAARIRLAEAEGISPEQMHLADPDELIGAARFLAERGEFARASRLLINRHPEGCSEDISDPALYCFVNSNFETAMDMADPLDRAPSLSLAISAHLPSHRLARPSAIFRKAMLAQIRELAANTNLHEIKHIADHVGGADRVMPELPMTLGRLAYAAGDLQLAISAAQRAAVLRPNEMMPWVLLMRAANLGEDLFGIQHNARRLLDVSDDPNHPLAVEARQRLERLPSRFYRAGSRAEDVIEAIRLFRAAAVEPALTDRCERNIRALEARAAAALRQYFVGGDEDFPNKLDQTLSALGSNRAVMLTAGRYFVKQRLFERAMPFWKSLVELDPSRHEHRFQLDRCLDRVARPSERASR